MSAPRITPKHGLVLLTPWQAGPAAAPDDTLVSFTDFRVRRFRDLVPVVKTAREIYRQWERRPGSLGLVLWVRPLKRRLGSLSAWDSEASLKAWINSADHAQAVRANRPHMRNVASATWTAKRFDLDEAWHEVEWRWMTGKH